MYKAQGNLVLGEHGLQHGVRMEYHTPKFTGQLLYVKPNRRTVVKIVETQLSSR